MAVSKEDCLFFFRQPNRIQICLTIETHKSFIMKTTRNITLTLLLMSACIMNAKAQCIANAGNDTTVCGYTVDLHGTWSHNAGAELLWTAMQTNVIFSDPTAEITTAVIPNYITPSYQVSFIFTETIPPGICVSSDTVVVTFLKPPHAEAGPVQHVCGYTATLNADTLGSGISSGSWSCNIPGIIFTTTGGGVVPAAYSDVDATGAAGQFVNSELEAWCYWTGTNSLGCSNTDSVMINFFEIPDAYAGEDDSICGKTYDLAGQFSLDNPTGSWSILTRPYPTSTANFIPSNSPDANVTVSDYGCYTFVWNEMNAGNVTCMDKDTISICFTTVPHPDAGPDQSVCGKFALLCATPTPGTDGYWQSVLNAWYNPSAWPQDTIFCMSCSNDPCVVAYYSSENDTVTYYYMEFNGQCYGYDSVNVYYGSIQPAIPLVNPTNNFSCGNVYTGLDAQMPSYGTGYWYESDPYNYFQPTIIYNSSNPAQPDSVVFDANVQGNHTFYWVTSNGNCGDTSNAVIISNGYSRVYAMVFYDINQNGIKDSVEPGLYNQALMHLPDNFFTSTGMDGYASLPTDTGINLIHLNYNFYNWVPTTDTIISYNPSTPCSSDTVYFGLYPIATDVSVYVNQSNICLPSTAYYQTISIINNGLLSSDVSCTLHFDSLFTFNNSSLPHTINASSISWTIGTMAPGQLIIIENNFTTPDLSHLGDTLLCNFSVTSSSPDYNLNNNAVNKRTLVRASYDPNDKQVVPAGVTEHGYVLHGEELEYTIRFQNTGNYYAMNVYLRDTISNVLDLSTLEIVSSSHPMFWQINNDREIVFTFSNIMLPWEDEDEPGSQGYVTYTISPNPGLSDYTEVANTAHIYFDYNPPIVTNTTLNTYVSVIPMSTESIENTNTLNIYPNPVTDKIYWEDKFKTYRVSVSSIDGKKLMEINNPSQNSIATESLSAGLYILTISTENGTFNTQLFKK